MNSSEWEQLSDLDIQRTIVKNDIDFENVSVDVSGNEIYVEVGDKTIPCSELTKLSELMKEKYAATLDRMMPSYYSVTFVYAIKDIPGVNPVSAGVVVQ